MSKWYRVICEEVDEETGEITDRDEIELSSVFLLGDHRNDHTRFVEYGHCIDQIELASKLAQGTHSRLAVKLANIAIKEMDRKRDENAISFEDLLGQSLEGGIQ